LSTTTVKLGLPKGRMQEGVFKLLSEAGVQLRTGSRGYRPSINLGGFEVKVLKPQNIVEMLEAGSRDVGFAGADWVAELNAHVVELVDTTLDPVRLVAAAPSALLEDGKLPKRTLVVASEYQGLAQDWIAKAGISARFVHSYGATEVFPPEDADCIIDNTATGATLVANGLELVGDVMRSSTRLYANPHALENREKREAIERLVMLLRSVLEARRRVMLEVNVSQQDLERLVAILPCMREPTVSPLHASRGYAVKAAVPREDLPKLIPTIKANGGTDIVVSSLGQIVP
jgi:ATP phosphoribosyltransferase